MGADSSKSLYLIEDLDDLESLAAELSASSRIAVDIESDSFYSYHPKICLIQISTDADNFIVDPLAIKDMSPLGPLLRDENIEKVFHAAEYDVQCLKGEYGFEIAHLFDTMAAARLLGSKQLGLAPIIQRYFAVTLSKKLQRADWSRRPLSREHIEYAYRDTHFLLPLRDKLHAELEERDLLQEAKEEFGRLERLEPTERIFDPDGFWRLSGARQLSPQSRAVLKELYLYRERTAAELDRAPFRVLPEALLVRVAHLLPGDRAALEKTSGMTSYLFRNYGRDLLEAVRSGLAHSPIENPPERKAPPQWEHDMFCRYEALRQWRKSKAQARGVEPVVILTTEDLRGLAKAPSQGPDPQAWLCALSERKRRLYGEEIVRLLQLPPAPSKKRKRRRRTGPPAANQ
ncbi:MAG: HRDC domain-containing protein [Elusimicrobia bacterium]|nr:HRDC domain-containing protein [Elusimicrobiota bacterium]